MNNGNYTRDLLATVLIQAIHDYETILRSIKRGTSYVKFENSDEFFTIEDAVREIFDFFKSDYCYDMLDIFDVDHNTFLIFVRKMLKIYKNSSDVEKS